MDCAFTFPVRTECGMFVLYAVLYACVCCFVVCGCAVSRRYIDFCYCDTVSVVNMYLLKFCVVCINGRKVGVLEYISIILYNIQCEGNSDSEEIVSLYLSRF